MLFIIGINISVIKTYPKRETFMISQTLLIEASPALFSKRDSIRVRKSAADLQLVRKSM
jgi:hypothetical protein